MLYAVSIINGSPSVRSIREGAPLEQGETIYEGELVFDEFNKLAMKPDPILVLRPETEAEKKAKKAKRDAEQVAQANLEVDKAKIALATEADIKKDPAIYIISLARILGLK